MAGIFKIGISRNTKCDILVGFPKSDHKYFRGYWETTKNFLLNISNNEIIPDENFPDYGIFTLNIYR